MTHLTHLVGQPVTETVLRLTDNTPADVSPSRHGLTPKLPSDASLFLDRGTYSTATP